MGFFILQKQLDNQGIFVIRSKLSNTAYLFLELYGSTTWQSRSFREISRTFYASRNYWIILVFFQWMLKEKLPFVLINTLLLHIPLLALTHGQNDGQIEKQIHSLHVGWRYWESICCYKKIIRELHQDRKDTLALRGLEELFLQLCCCVSFLFGREIGFGFTYYLCT